MTAREPHGRDLGRYIPLLPTPIVRASPRALRIREIPEKSSSLPFFFLFLDTRFLTLEVFFFLGME